MAGLDPAIHDFLRNKTWMPGTRPGMTTENTQGREQSRPFSLRSLLRLSPHAWRARVRCTAPAGLFICAAALPACRIEAGPHSLVM
jgi:hypothetical protein